MVPGAFSKKLNHAATSASYLRKDNEKCDSTFYVTYKILNQEFLKLLNGRYYYDERGLMRKLDYKTDEHLIGKVVNFLSPATCASTEGICRYCYGHLYDINKDMFSVGSLAA